MDNQPGEPRLRDLQLGLATRKIVLVTGYIPPYMLNVYVEIRRRLPRFSILVSTPMEGNRQWEANWGDLDVTVQRTWTGRKWWRHQAGFTEPGEFHIPLDTRKRLQEIEPDIVVSEELGLRSVACAVYTARRPTVPLALICNLSEHTEQGRGWVRLKLRRWLAKQAAVTMVNGDSGARYLQNIGFLPDSIRRFPYVAEPGYFEHTPLFESRSDSADAARRHVVTCGDLSRRKGISQLVLELDQWARAHPGDRLKLSIVGTGQLAGQLEGFEAASNFEVALHGFLKPSQLARLYAQADVFAFATLADEWGLVVNEALAAGLPVLGSVYSQAVDELIREDVNGWRFRPDDARSFQTAVARCLQAPKTTIEAMRAACRRSVALRTPAWAAEQFVAALRSLAE